MKPIEEFLENLVSLGINVWIEEGRLRCRASKEKLTPEIKNELAERKQEILQFLQRNQLDASLNDFQIKRVSRSETIPVSFSQQRLWVLEQLEGSNAAYNEGGAFRLEGNLEVKTLQKALEEIIRRHEVIRTNIQEIDGVPSQIIRENCDFSLEKIDLSALSAEEQQEAWEEIAFNKFQSPFNLEKDLLLRVALVKLGETSNIFLLIMHHIICDGWSFGVLIKELSTLYEAFKSGLPSPLPELTIQYADYAAWQREWLSGERLQNKVDYWKKKLSGLPPLLELPTDYPRPPVQTFKGAKETFILSPELSQKLQQLSKQLGVTLFMTLLSAFAILLFRYSRQEDIVIGSPIANRKRSEIEPLVGFFANTLVMRVNLENNTTVKELVEQVEKTCLEAYTHQDVPFEKLVEELKPERNMSHSPLFQAMFILSNFPARKLNLTELNLSTMEIETGIAKFDIILSLEETAEGLKGIWEYNTAIFGRELIKRMADHFKILLEGIVTNPEEKIGKLSILTQAEQHKILVQWNDTATEYPKDLCVHQFFEEQVEKTPNAVAVVYKEEKLTYQELNQKANQLAHYLLKLGIKPDQGVGICLERSLEMVISILAILKAGGAYIPIDSAYPQERINYMLFNAQVSILITTGKLLKKLSLKMEGVNVVEIDQNSHSIIENSSENCHTQVTSDRLAYIIHTSGSTGNPKGIAMEHRPLVNLINWQKGQSILGLGSKTLQFAPIGFDVSFQEMFSTWCIGGQLFLIEETLRRDPESLISYIIQQGIDRIFLPFVALQQIAESASQINRFPNCLKEIITAGEQLQITPSITTLFEGIPSCRLYNHYGPSESHVVTSYTLSETIKHWSLLPPIGGPIDNAKIYLLDREQNPVPIGVAGELHIGGVGLARGYINRPDLTIERFINNPFDSTGTSRLYKTGDLCRYLPDGNIEYIGRIDNQVKIRGFRIELGEIESFLSTYPDLRECVVIVREDEPGNKRLVAYIVSQQEDIKIGKLRDFLKQQLPDYMIPSAFVLLEKLPLTPNGKVDRKNLPAPDLNLLTVGDDYLPPCTPTQEILANIWQEVLKLEKISISSNFFEIGGHSLLATQIISRLRQSFAVDIPLRILFEQFTIEKMATHIDNILWLRQSKNNSEDAKMNQWEEGEI